MPHALPARRAVTGVMMMMTAVMTLLFGTVCVCVCVCAGAGPHHGPHGDRHASCADGDHVQPEAAPSGGLPDVLQQMEPALLGEGRRGTGQARPGQARPASQPHPCTYVVLAGTPHAHTLPSMYTCSRTGDLFWPRYRHTRIRALLGRARGHRRFLPRHHWRYILLCQPKHSSLGTTCRVGFPPFGVVPEAPLCGAPGNFPPGHESFPPGHVPDPAVLRFSMLSDSLLSLSSYNG